jgi:hypothetical protein
MADIQQATINSQRLLADVEALLRLLAGVRSVPAMKLPADQHKVG